MAKNYYDITLALAGICQSARLVQQLAHQGHCDADALHVSLNSIIDMNPSSTLAVFGGSEANLRVGLETLLGVKFGMNKAERLDYGESLMTHAMVFQGVNLDESGKPNRWRVENSWGDKAGEKGYYVMSDAWFDEYMYQVVVNKKYLPAEFVKEYESEPIMLEPWDPMGSLARMI